MCLASKGNMENNARLVEVAIGMVRSKPLVFEVKTFNYMYILYRTHRRTAWKE